jgi:hypothetical protein
MKGESQMNRNRFRIPMAAVMTMMFASAAFAQVPDLTQSEAYVVNPEGRAIYMTPSGTGPTLAEQGVSIVVILRDASANPIVGYPKSAIALEAYEDEGDWDWKPCTDAMIADQDTDLSGTTSFDAAPLHGGGWTEEGPRIRIGELGYLPCSWCLTLRLNSPDINGDLAVNLSDVGLFASDFLSGTAAFRSDLVNDGVINLADVGQFALSIGESCP